MRKLSAFLSVLVLLVVAACGGGGSGAGDPAAAGPSVTQEASASASGAVPASEGAVAEVSVPAAAPGAAEVSVAEGAAPAGGAAANGSTPVPGTAEGTPAPADTGGAAPSPTEVASTAGILRILITDAPFPSTYVVKATMVVSGVWVHEEGGDDHDWTQVLHEERTIDLVPLVGGITEILVEAAIEPGTYDMVRMAVSGGEVWLGEDAVVDGVPLDPVDRVYKFRVEDDTAKFPSGKVDLHISPAVVVVTHLSAELLLDVDLTKSFVFNRPPTHGQGTKRILFKPVARALNESENGRIVVEVSGDNATPDDTADDQPLPGAVVKAIDAGGDEVAVVLADAFGVAEIVLPPGTYALEIWPPDDPVLGVYDHLLLEGVEVYLANATDLAVTLAATEGQISGSVLGDAGTPEDPADDAALEGVTVTLSQEGVVLATQLTDAQGAYRFDGLVPGAYDLLFEKDAYETGALSGVDAVVVGYVEDVVLAKLPFLAGTVLGDGGTPDDGSDDAPLEGVLVTVAQDGAEVATQLTDADGAYRFDPVEAGSYELTFAKELYATQTITAEASTTDALDPVVLARLPFLAGTVLGDGGTPDDGSDDAPLEGVLVTVAQGGAEVATQLTDADGAYRFDPVEAGSYELTFAKELYATQTITAEASTTDALDPVVLARLPFLAGTVLGDGGTPDDGSDDAPLEGVLVTVAQGGAEVATQLTDADGAYRFDPVEAGSYELTFAKELYATQTITAEASTTDALDPVVLARLPFLAGTVLGDGGTPDDGSDDAPLEGVLVTVAQDGAEVATQLTDADGAYRFDPVEAGSYELTFAKELYATQTVAAAAVTTGALADVVLAQLPPPEPPPEEPSAAVGSGKKKN